MASTETVRKLSWMKRLRRKRLLSAEDSAKLQDPRCPTRIQTLKSRLSRKLVKTQSDSATLRWTTKDECFNSGDDLSASYLDADATSSGNFKQLSMDLDRHQKCVTNLAATVVRQNKELCEMQNYIAALQSLLLQNGIPIQIDYEEVEPETAELES